MGLTASTDASSSTKKTRLEYLGDRYPFGDAELMRLARCHAYLRRRRRTRDSSRSFLSDLATNAAGNNSGIGHAARAAANSAPSDAADAERAAKGRGLGAAGLMEIVEGRVLPPGFGRRLERAAFLLPHHTEEEEEDEAGNANIGASAGASTRFGTGDSNPPSNVDDIPDPLLGGSIDDDAFRRLEQFLDGAADCCRRGSRPALAVLFKSCIRSGRGGRASDDNHRSNDTGSDPGGLRADAGEVLELAYRLALAAAFLADASSLQPSVQDLDGFANAYVPSKQVGACAALTQSLLEYATKREQEMQSHVPPSYAAKGELDLDPYTGRAVVTPPISDQSSSTNARGGGKNLVALAPFLEWAEQTAPCLSACLSTFLHRVWFPSAPYPPSRTPFVYPRLAGQRSAFFDHPSSPLLFSLACASPSLGGSWHRLYTSDSDGLSFNRLFSCLLGYGGPTLLIVREAEGGGVFGAFTATAWKESKDFYGNSDCFLFQASPSVGVYRPRGRGSNFMYCNSVSRSRGYDGLAHGIGFGGTDALPRLFVAETFDGCVASSADLTFEPGPLLPPAREGGGSRKYFSISDLEVWGVGGDEAVASGLDARKAQRAILDANIQKARKVDKAQFLDDFKSGLIESKAFQHRTEARGRHDFEADDKGGGGYKLPADKRGSVVKPSRTVPGTGL